MKTGIIVLIVVGFALLLGGCQFVQERNKLASEREAISGEWSQVDADLQRRADLIPNLVEAVKGYAKEETTVFEALAMRALRWRVPGHHRRRSMRTARLPALWDVCWS